MTERRAVAGEEASGGARADRYIAETLGWLTRSQLKARGAELEVNGRREKPSRIVRPGDAILLRWEEEPEPGVLGEDIPLAVIHEDERCIVVDKPQGMVVHPAAGARSGTLVHALAWRFEGFADRFAVAAPGDGSPDGGAPGGAVSRSRPGIVHRLDKETSGAIIVAKDAAAHAYLSAQFKERRVRKRYLAIVQGRLPAQSGRVRTMHGRDPKDRKRFACVEAGKPALTEYRVLATYGARQFVLLEPRTGRTHQLRVHMRSLGAPIMGDAVYGRKDARFPDCGLMLHAWRLRIPLPPDGAELEFHAVLPARFKDLLIAIGKR